MQLVEAFKQSLKFDWEPPISMDRNGHIIGYECYISDQNGWNDVKTVNLTETAFEELQPSTNYTVQIAAMTSAGTGPYSEPIIVRTKSAGKYET